LKPCRSMANSRTIHPPGRAATALPASQSDHGHLMPIAV
jgi:hypothetical protein